MQRFTPLEYLKVDIASTFGLDKKTWNERLSWFEENQGQLHALLPQAENPALYFAGILAYEDVKQGKPIGYPISLDATSSGLQLLAVLTGDRSAAEICNVVNVGNRMDAYTAVYQRMVDTLGEASKIKREDCKDAIMTALYGSTRIPKDVFGEGQLLQTFLDTMSTITPGAWELNELFLQIWDDKALMYQWVLPDNFHVQIKVMGSIKERVHFLNQPFEVVRRVNMPSRYGRSLGANTIHSLDGMIVREMNRRCSYDPVWINLLWDLLTDEGTHFIQKEAKQEAIKMTKILWQLYEESGFLSARILDYLDGDTIELVDQKTIQELLESLPLKPFSIISVHDCFRCHPKYANDLRWQYNNQLMLIAKSQMLSFLLSQILKNPIQTEKLDSNLYQDILNTDYALS